MLGIENGNNLTVKKIENYWLADFLLFI
jgi:hypothetical protein